MQQGIISVNELNVLLKSQIENSDIFRDLHVVGEISNLVFNKSGHVYFSLKDEYSSISCMIWKSKAHILKNLNPQDGMKINVTGHINYYVPYGKISLEVIDVQLNGVGELQQLYEARKNELQELGWFNRSLKQPIPQFPKNIGIVTAGTGAAVHDLISTIQRRWPIANIWLFPAKVQGKGASEDLASKIIQANNFKTPIDVLIVGRGGGSYEDLWEFNEMPVLTAVKNSHIPVISAVGHEPDITLIDYVADKRAATPTAAGELSTPNLEEIIEGLNYQRQILISSLNNKFKLWETSMKEQYRQLENSLLRKEESQSKLIEHQYQLLTMIMKNLFGAYATKVNHLEETLKILNPVNPLKRGYVLISKDNKVLGPEDEIDLNDQLTIRREKDKVLVNVLRIEGVKK